jgi:hypothetical protein
MKKILLFLIIALLLCISAVYLLIPNRISVSEKTIVNANQEALLRKMGNTTNWQNWWPGEKMTGSQKNDLLFNSYQYEITDQKTLSIPVLISKPGFKTLTEFTFIAINTESTTVFIDAIIPTSYNPFKRLQLFFAANRIKKDVKTILQLVKEYYSVTSNLYGYDIQKKRVIDSTLLSNVKEIKSYPSTEIIYSLVDELKEYIKKQSAVETGFPMLNIFTKDSITYLVKVAIPVNKKLPDSGNISYKWMLGGGNILITEVKGGNGEIQKAYHQVQIYISDYKRTAPAIPFQSLVTDRRKEPDSSKWVTRIYYPVM